MERIFALHEVLQAAMEKNLDKVRLLFLDLAKSEQREHLEEAAFMGMSLIRAEYAHGRAIADQRYMHEAIGWWVALLTDDSDACETVHLAIDAAMEDETMPPELMGLIVNDVLVHTREYASQVHARERRQADDAS